MMAVLSLPGLTRLPASTFIGIAVRNFTSAGQHGTQAVDLAAGIRQDASGILGTTLSLEDLVKEIPSPRVCAHTTR